MQLTLFDQKKIALLGLGKSGMVTAQALHESGATIFAFDDNENRCEEAQEKGIPIKDLREIDWSFIDMLVLSPGVPLTHPEPHWAVRLAQKAHCPILGDMALFFAQKQISAPEAKTICITGTNGKSTTTALMTHILTEAGYDAVALGNIGNPILAHDQLKNDQIYVIEMSSYQIDLAPNISPDYALLLNLSEDHLDRHGSMKHYAKVKESLLANALRSQGKAYLSLDDNWCQHAYISLSNAYQQGLTSFSMQDEQADYYCHHHHLYTQEKQLFDLDQFMNLKGVHNYQNCAGAVAIVRDMKIDDEVIFNALKSFKGLPHRMEYIGGKNNIQFINDSKATNADAAAKSLAAFDNIYWLLGGQSKKGGIESLKGYFSKIRHAFLFGQDAEIFAKTLDGECAYSQCETLEKAVYMAFKQASMKQEKAIILLAPAAASWDQFDHFEHRGEVFRECAIKQIEMDE